EICKCTEDDKVKFAMCTLEGHALTWWHRNVQTLGLANANQIPWSNLKAVMTTEYCPATEIQKMEQEIWTLNLKRDDIKALLKGRRLKSTFVGFLKESKEISLLQSRQLYMMPSTWPVNWLSKQFRVGLPELVKEIKGSGKTTKETPTTITPITTTTPVPRLAEAPDNQNGWIEWDVPLGGKMDEPMESPGFDEGEELNEFMDDDQDEEVEEWLMAPVTPPRATVTVPSTYEYRHEELVKKMEIVSDDEAADSIAIREIHPRATTLKGQVQTLQTSLHGAWLQNQELQTRLSEMEIREGTLISFMCWMEDRLVVLEKRLIGPPTGPQLCCTPLGRTTLFTYASNNCNFLPKIHKDFVGHILTEHPDIPKRLNEPYHRVENDKVVKSIFNYGKRKGLGMKILEWIHNRLSLPKDRVRPSVPRPLNPQEHQCESSALRKSTIIRIPRRRQSDPETSVLTADQIDVDNMDEATRVSIATVRSIKDYEAQQAVKKVEENVLEEDVENIVEGEDIDANKFVDDMINTQEYPDTRIDLRSHKEILKVKKDVDVVIIDKEIEEELVEDALVRKKRKVSLEIRDTPLSTPTRSPRTHTDSSSSNKEELKELTAFEPTSSSSKPKTDRSKHIKGAIARMSRQYGYIFRHIKKSFMPRKDMNSIGKKVEETLKEVVPMMVDETTNDNMKKNLLGMVVEGIRMEREKTKADIASMIAEAVRKEQERHASHVGPFRVDTVHRCDHEEHHDEDALLEGESKQQEDFDPWSDDQCKDDEEVHSKKVSLELLAEVSGKGITTYDLKRMQDARNDMMKSRCDSGEEYQNHLDQMKGYIGNMSRALLHNTTAQDTGERPLNVL
nr:hypothetical protein [Tanacetum cinerariifolium]